MSSLKRKKIMNQFKNNYRNSLKYSISSRFAERNTDKFGKVL